MKPLNRFVIFFLAMLAMVATAHAQSPREQLNQLVTQLRANPTDTALREKIIKLVHTIKPMPAVPEETQRRLGRGQAAFETAKEPGDFEKAIAEFQAASNAAPWLAAPYYNLGVAQEKAKKYREAMANFRLYLLGSPGSPDTSEVRQRIFKLEYLAEQPAAPPSDEVLLARVNGARFVLANQHAVVDSIGDEFFEISGRQLIFGYTVRQLGPTDRQYNAHTLNDPTRFPPRYEYKGGLRWEDANSCKGVPGCVLTSYVASDDGRLLTVRYWARGSSHVKTYPRAD